MSGYMQSEPDTGVVYRQLLSSRLPISSAIKAQRSVCRKADADGCADGRIDYVAELHLLPSDTQSFWRTTARKATDVPHAASTTSFIYN